jgi:hypothetical protein
MAVGSDEVSTWAVHEQCMSNTWAVPEENHPITSCCFLSTLPSGEALDPPDKNRNKKKPAGESGLNPISFRSWRRQMHYAASQQNLPILI